MFAYAPLVRALGGDRPVYAFQAPGVERGEPRARIEDLAELYVERLREHSAPPYLLGGWSLGGIVAFEMGRLLRDDEDDVGLVAIVDTPAPGKHTRIDDPTDLLCLFAEDIAQMLGTEVALDRERLRRFEERAREAEVLRVLDEAEPGQLDSETFARRWRVFRAHYEAVFDYRGGDYDGDVLFVAAADGTSAADDWRRVVRGELRVRTLPGDHYEIMRPPLVQQLAEALRSALPAAAPYAVAAEAGGS